MVRDDLVEPRMSPIHGRGLFAVGPIELGTLIGVYTGRRGRRWSAGPYALHTYDEDGEWAGCVVGQNAMKLINHSTSPNVEIDGEHRVWVLRDIEEGEEITWYYGDAFQSQVERDAVAGAEVG